MSPSGKEAVELRAVSRESRALVEHFRKDVLDRANFATDGKRAAELLFEIGRGREMIGVIVRFEEPLHAQALLTDVLDHCVCELERGSPRRLVEVENAVDDGRVSRRGIVGNVSGRKGRFVEERLDDRHLGVRRRNSPTCSIAWRRLLSNSISNSRTTTSIPIGQHSYAHSEGAVLRQIKVSMRTKASTRHDRREIDLDT